MKHLDVNLINLFSSYHVWEVSNRFYFETDYNLKYLMCQEPVTGHIVDILVQYDRSRPIGLMKIVGMKVNLEDLLNCEVDLVEEGTLRPWAVESVNHDKKLIYERA